MAVGKVSDTTFDSEVLKATGPVVVDFWAEWCGPCRMIAPALEEIAGSLGDKVKIVKLNVDENPQTASKYGIQSIPTLMIFKDGQLASRQIRHRLGRKARRLTRDRHRDNATGKAGEILEKAFAILAGQHADNKHERA